MPCRTKKPCVIPGCEHINIKGRGLCQQHYDRDFRARTGKAEKEQVYRRTVAARYKRAIYRAKDRGLLFTLSREEYAELINKPCHYCGTTLSDTAGVSLDRIDNLEGYLPHNVLPCCGQCNALRSDKFTVAETEVMVGALLAYRKSK